ncbi:MAG: hypothetical protein CME36_14925 [unclassified Hahellaceae]|nr:hypothetical protein [Hahellaceae bacterium]|tara:strand:+ start:19689 stop:21284 length:1596 start_codon:yes stop_codon:yes gene_type:complete
MSVLNKRRRYHMLHKLEEHLEIPMFLLAVAWLVLLLIELTKGLSLMQERFVMGIWIIFILEYLLKFILAPHKLRYVKQQWLTLIALFIPAFRAFRLLNAIRVLRVTPVLTTTRMVRALTSGSRFIRAMQEAQGPQPSPEMNVGVLLAVSRSTDVSTIRSFARRISEQAKSPLQAASGIDWKFHITDPIMLESENSLRPSDFLDDASLRMAEGPFDAVIVITDVGLLSRQKHMEAGLASSVTRVMIMSTRELVAARRGDPARGYASDLVLQDGLTLLLHLLGRMCGLNNKTSRQSSIMRPFRRSDAVRPKPTFTDKERQVLHKRAPRLPERELRGSNVLTRLVFHMLMAFRHLPTLVRPLLRNRALLLPLSLPSLATAAVAPSFLLVFTAEIWDVGLNMSNQTTAWYAVVSIVAASFYLVRIQSLFLPHREKRVLTEHLAVANAVIFLSILLACVGLFFLVASLMFLVEIYIFPEGLMKTWPTLLDQVEINWGDKARLAAFISTIGVTTGALAGGLDSRTVIRHLALFHEER